MTKTVLLTRPQRQSVETAGKLWERGWKSRIAPLFIIEPIPAVIDAAKYQAILLTSANAAPALKDLPSLPIYAVGDSTAQTARNITSAPVESAAGDAATLIELIKRTIDPTKGPLLYLSGLDRSVDLEAPGFTIDIKEVYAARPTENLSAAVIEALKDGQIFATLLYSPAAARQFRSVMERTGAALGDISLITLSSKVTEAAGPGWKSVKTAESPNEEALFQLLEQCYAAPVMPEPIKPSRCSSPKVAQVAFNLAVIALIIAGTVPLWSPYAQNYFGIISPVRDKVEGLQNTVNHLAHRIESQEGNKTAAPTSEHIDVSPLKAEVSALNERLTTINDELAKSREHEAELAAALEKVTTTITTEKKNDAVSSRLSAALQLSAAIQNGEPFTAQLTALRALNDPIVTSALDAASIDAYQEQGLPTRAKLLASYAPAVRTALANSKPKGDGLLAGSLSGLSGLVSVRKQGEVEGDDAESIFARAEVKLTNGDLAAALTELDTLPEPAIFKDWHDQAQARLKAERLAADLANVKTPSSSEAAGQTR